MWQNEQRGKYPRAMKGPGSVLRSLFNSCVCLNRMIGISGRVEMIILAAAITSEFASAWAYRMMIAAVEMLITPKNNMRYWDNRECCEVFNRQFFFSLELGQMGLVSP